MERQEGYYWVKYDDKFEIAYWNCIKWYMIESPYSYEDSDFEHINENRIKAPGELPDQYMEKLVLKGHSPDEIVRYYFPEKDDEDIDWIIWENTGWPFADIEWIAEEIYEYYLKNKR